ncbi:MAG: C/D box methylation guide ribonucleoprotein complex aNOP56 subunit, partial [Thermoprotei archaeon]
IVEDENLAINCRGILEEKSIRVEPSNKVAKAFRANIAVYMIKLGLSEDEYRKFTYDVSLALTRKKVRKAAEKRDLFIAQAINALDDVDKTINLFSSRIREWYGLHFPELDEILEEHEDYVKVVSLIGSREKISKEPLMKIGIKEDLAEKIVSAAKKSMGADITDFDIDAIRNVSNITLELFKARRRLEKYIDEAMLEVAPNVRGLVGPLLGARLISLAGGLSKLATLPASTIQVLGAEKALFRALRTGTRPPKHGVIFQYPAIHRSPRWQRGKIARALAAKLAIAARIDAFSGEYKADELKEELEKRIEEVKTLYARPPPRKERVVSRRGKRRKGRRK